jgi:glyoxylase-like metal-dependent hydrolase (beta-lactamase superfamily II)
MTEPREIAETTEEVAEGILHWRIADSRIGGAIASSHAVIADDACVLVDPVGLAEEAFAALPRPEAILLTASCHQRSAWRYRSELGTPVWLPVDARPADEKPDRRYLEGDLLPGGLRAIRTPGPEHAHYSFLLERDPGVLFCSDLLASTDAGELVFVPPEYHEDPTETRRSVEKLLSLPFSILCLDHGAPVTRDPKAKIRALLAATPGPAART